MDMIVVYDHPEDYPTQWIARLFKDNKPTGMAWGASTLEILRQCKPAHMVIMPRMREDVPAIAEIWI